MTFIIGIGGACRKIELLNMFTEHVVDNGEHIKITIPDSKTYEPREFFITAGSMNGVNLLAMIRKYMSLRPVKATTNRFFLGFRNGKCTVQPVGTNTFAEMPRKIATFLGLNDVQRFTGHCFRRSSATILAENGAGLLTIKRAGGWKSDRVAAGYIHNTSAIKRKISATIFGSNNEATASKKFVASTVSAAPSFYDDDISKDTTDDLSIGSIDAIITMDELNEIGVFESNANSSFGSGNGIATVHSISSSQITKQSVALPNVVNQPTQLSIPKSNVLSIPIATSHSIVSGASNFVTFPGAPIYPTVSGASNVVAMPTAPVHPTVSGASNVAAMPTAPFYPTVSGASNVFYGCNVYLNPPQ